MLLRKYAIEWLFALLLLILSVVSKADSISSYNKFTVPVIDSFIRFAT